MLMGHEPMLVDIPHLNNVNTSSYQTMIVEDDDWLHDFALGQIQANSHPTLQDNDETGARLATVTEPAAIAEATDPATERVTGVEDTASMAGKFTASEDKDAKEAAVSPIHQVSVAGRQWLLQQAVQLILLGFNWLKLQQSHELYVVQGDVPVSTTEST